MNTATKKTEKNVRTIIMNCPAWYYTYWTCVVFERQMVSLWDPVSHMCPCPRKEWVFLHKKINVLFIQQEKLQELPRKVNHVEELRSSDSLLYVEK